jgi:CDP-glucose 4,6-dehydratase
MPVRQLVEAMLRTWGKPGQRVQIGQSPVHEANYLRLDSSLARADLGWRPLLDFEQTMAWTADWYKHYCDDPTKAKLLMNHQISAYSELCSSL